MAGKKKQNKGQRSLQRCGKCKCRSEHFPAVAESIALSPADTGHLPVSSSGGAVGLCSCAELQVRGNVIQYFSPGKKAAGSKPPVSCTALSCVPGRQRGSRSCAKHIALITIFRQCLSCKMTERLGVGQHSWNPTLQLPCYSDLVLG